MPSGPEQVGLEQPGIATVLAGYWLSVPPNQREYSWTDQVQKLFQDLSKAIADRNDSYFLGLVVTVAKEPGRLEIIDGQQRLATTAILLAAMREYLLDLGESVISDAVDRILYDIDTSLRDRVPRLKLNTEDNEFFRREILKFDQDSPSIPSRLESHRKMVEAKELADKHIQAVVSGFKESDRADELVRWLDFLRHKANVILLKVPSAANAYKMFETLNDRGMDTTQADLIKNYLFGQSGPRLAEAQARWSQMRGSLGLLEEKGVLLTFLRQAAISLYGHIREGDLFESVERHVRGPRDAIQFLDSLEASAFDYVAVLSHSSDKWNIYPQEVREAIEALSLLAIKPVRPLMLAVARVFSPREATLAFRSMVSWQVRLLVNGRTRSEATERPLNDMARDVMTLKITTRDSLWNAIQALIPNDVSFTERFATLSVAKPSLARYYLRSIERAMKEEGSPWYIPNDSPHVITLEHILPLKPGNNWPGWDAESHHSYVNKLGNQALLQASTNSGFGSAPFSNKRDALLECPYESTKLAGRQEEWNRASVVARQRTLAEYALKAWPI